MLFVTAATLPLTCGWSAFQRIAGHEGLFHIAALTSSWERRWCHRGNGGVVFARTQAQYFGGHLTLPTNFSGALGVSVVLLVAWDTDVSAIAAAVQVQG